MNEVMKDNDILLATLLDPNATNVDLLKNNITLNNTQLLERDSYKELPSILKIFSKDGAFNEEAFNSYYDLAEAKYRTMQEDKLMSDLVDQLEYSLTSFFRKPTDKVASTEYKGMSLLNPLQQAIGLEGINVKSKATKTEKEVALSHNIWDPINQKWLDDSAESRNIFQKVFGESLVYAKYTKDGYQENPITKEIDYHTKGEFIKDDEGNYFTQLAGSVDLINGTETVKLLDILSTEDSWWNKVDFFDSDSVEKSIPGIVMKTLVTTLPYFLPYVGPAYTTAAILVGLGLNLPQIAKSFDFSNTENSFTEGCNKVINWFDKFSPSTTLTGLERFLSLENLGQLTADMVGQLYQQRGMAYLSNYLVRTNKDLKKLEGLSLLEQYKIFKLEYIKRANVSKALSLGYMSLVQAGDVYNDALNAGYGRGVAGLATLASTGAFFGIMNFNESVNGLGTWFLDKTTGYDREVLRTPISQLAKSNVISRAENEELKRLLREGSSKFAGKLRDYWLKFWNKVDDAVRIGSEGAWTAAIAEGVEEVSEEVVQDGVKGIIDGLNYLGYTASDWGDPEASFGGWSNVFSQEGLERYLQTFFGGAFGGTMFHITLNKIKPFTDSLFGIKSDIQKPVKFDLIDIALRGLGDTYMKEVDTAVKFIGDNELDLTTENGEKTYKAREAVAQALKNEMKTTLDLVESILAGADFSKIDEDFRIAIKESFKPFITSTGAISYITKNFEYNIKQLADVITDIKNKEKDIEDKKEGLDIEKTKEDIKNSKELAKKLRENVIGYFTGKSYVDVHDEASWLVNRNLVNAIRRPMTDEEYYNNVLKEANGGLEYVKLVLESDDPNTLSLKRVAEENKLFSKIIAEDFEESQLPELFKLLPVLNRAFKSLASFIGKDITAYTNEERKRTVIKNAIQKMKVDRSLLEELYKQAVLLTLLDSQEYKNASEELKKVLRAEKEAEIQDQINKSVAIKDLVDIIKKDPKAFSLSERYNIDYFSILKNKGIIELDDKALTKEQIRVILALVNNEFANVPLTTLSKENIKLILNGVQLKLNDSKANIFGQMFVATAKDENTATLTENPSLATFDINIDNYSDDLEFIKLNDIESYIEKDGELNSNLISEDLYNYLLDAYKKADSKFLDKIRGIDSDVDENINKYLNNPILDNKNNLIDSIRDSFELTDDIVTSFAERLSINIENNPELSDSENISKAKLQIISIIIQNLKTADFILKYGNKEKVTNNFLEAINKISFSIGNSAEKNKKISELINEWTLAILKNEALGVDESITQEDLSRIRDVLSIFMLTASVMAPGQDENGNVIEGIFLRNKNFADAMGLDSSQYYLIDSEELDLFQTMVSEMINKLTTLNYIYKNVELELAAEFKKVREKMISNSYRLIKLHIADKDDPLYIEELAKEIAEEDDTKLTIEQQLEKLLQYRQAVYLHIHNPNFGGQKLLDYKKEYPSEEEALIKFLMDVYGRNADLKYKNDIFYYGDTATDANNLSGSNGAYASYFLNELVGLASITKYNPKQIEEAILKAFEDSKMYPRLDLIYSIYLAILGILGKTGYSIYGHELENWYNDENSKGAVKQYIENLIRIPGPAGSGKTALYSILIKALKNLNVDSNIVISALQDYKVENIKEDLKDTFLLNEVNYSSLYSLFSNLKDISSNYKILESKVFGKILNVYNEIKKEIAEEKNKAKESNNAEVSEEKTIFEKTTKIDNDNPDYGDITVSYDINKKRTTATIKSGNFDFDLSIPDLDSGAPNFSDTVYNFKNKSFETILPSITLDNGVLIVDECTNLNPFEWQLLNHLAKDKNFNIIATGDTYQRGYRYNIGNRLIYIGDENILGLNTPALESIHRGMNSAVKNNESAIRNIYNAAIELALKNTEDGKKGTHEGLNSFHFDTPALGIIFDALAALKLEYTLSDDVYGLLGANITNTEEDFIESINSIKDKDKRSILVITNNDSDASKVKDLLTAKGFKNDNVHIVDINDVLGAEADYAIAYNIKPYSNPADKTHQGLLSDLKEIYTLVTRGRFGFISFGQNDIFSSNKVQSSSNKPVVKISNRETPKEGSEWLTNWKAAIDTVKDGTTSVPEPKLQILQQVEELELPIPESNELSEEDYQKTLTQNIKNSFGDTPWFIMRQYGYYLGLSLNTINNIVKQYSEITNDNTLNLLNEETVKGTSFYTFLSLLSENSDIKFYSDSDKLIVVSALDKAVKEAKNDLDSDSGIYIDAYIRFINILREESVNGNIHAYNLLSKPLNKEVSADNPDIAYLKVNDNTEKWGSKINAISIPVFNTDQATLFGQVILGTIGYSEEFSKLFTTEPHILYYNPNESLLDAHKKAMKTYYGKVKFTNVSEINGPLSLLTNLRDFMIVSDWLENVANAALGKATWNELEKLGYELVPGEDNQFVINTNTNDPKEQLSEFISWYNKYRFGEMNPDKQSKFAPLLKHAGTFVVVRPKSTLGKGFPVLLKESVDWNTFIGTGNENGNLSGYQAANIIYALTRSLNLDSYKNLSFGEIKNIILENKEQLSNLIDTITDKLSKDINNKKDTVKEVLNKIVNNVINANEFDILKKLKISMEFYKANDFKNGSGKAIFEHLNRNLPKFPYVSVTGTHINSDIIVERIFEWPDVLFNLSLFSDNPPQNTGNIDTSLTPLPSKQSLTNATPEFIADLINAGNIKYSKEDNESIMNAIITFLSTNPNLNLTLQINGETLQELMNKAAINIMSFTKQYKHTTSVGLQTLENKCVKQLMEKANIKDEDLNQFCRK